MIAGIVPGGSGVPVGSPAVVIVTVGGEAGRVGRGLFPTRAVLCLTLAVVERVLNQCEQAMAWTRLFLAKVELGGNRGRQMSPLSTGKGRVSSVGSEGGCMREGGAERENWIPGEGQAQEDEGQTQQTGCGERGPGAQWGVEGKRSRVRSQVRIPAQLVPCDSTVSPRRGKRPR